MWNNIFPTQKLYVNGVKTCQIMCTSRKIYFSWDQKEIVTLKTTVKEKNISGNVDLTSSGINTTIHILNNHHRLCVDAAC